MRRRRQSSSSSSHQDNVKLKTTSWIHRDNYPSEEASSAATTGTSATRTSSPTPDFSIGEGTDIEIYHTSLVEEESHQLLNYSTDVNPTDIINVASSPPVASSSLRRATSKSATLQQQEDGQHEEVKQIERKSIEEQNYQEQEDRKLPPSSEITDDGGSSSSPLPDISDIFQKTNRPQHHGLNHIEIDFISFSRQGKDDLLNHLQQTSLRGKLTLINLSRRGLGVDDANILKQAMHVCPQLSSLKLSYNNLGDEGAAIIASGFVMEGGRHHFSLSVLDLGFNCVGESGCSSLALHAVAGNRTFRTLYLSGNNIGEKGCLSLAGAILQDSGLTCLHLTENRIGTDGVKALSRAVAETEERRLVQLRMAVSKGFSIETIAANSISTMQELHLGGTSMQSEGFYSISNMNLTNLSLRVLSLSANGINDQDMNLFAQSITQNKAMPLEVLNLSFNDITCLGIECLMNAVWGSKTLRVIRLDNNRVKDRGAQLVAVVLTSIHLEVIDLAFNRITTVGIKAIMKSVSENSSMTSLNISGIPLDPNASKAVCYALAYNTSLRSLYIDNCSVSYSAQRHIAAGVVSNQNASLRMMTGFQLGPITVTLGLPKVLESWSNDQVLKFVCIMWKRWRVHRGEVHSGSQLQKGPGDDDNQSVGTNISSGTIVSSDGQRTEATAKSTPADPKTVVLAAKNALPYLSTAGGEAALRTEPHERNVEDTSPLVPPNATMLERTSSGTLRVPSPVEASLNCDKSIGKTEHMPQVDETEAGVVTLEGKISSPLSSLSNSSHDNLNRSKNIQWLRTHFKSLNEVSLLPFDGNEFRQLHHYYNSTVGMAADDAEHNDDDSLPPSSDEVSAPNFLGSDIGIKRSGTARKVSGHRVDSSSTTTTDALNQSDRMGSDTGSVASSSGGKRRSCHLFENADEDDQSQRSYDSNCVERKSKRAKNAAKPRIAYYRRIQEKLNEFTSKASREKEALALLRQLKFVESVLFQGRDASELTTKPGIRGPELATRRDVEIILLDLL